MSTHPIGYSYIRFSTPEQSRGDSLRRQTEAAAAWCKAHGVRLDESVTRHDLGKSAYLGEHRKNPDRHALAAFLKLVEAGKVPRGSYLIIESLDRLTREHVRAGLMLMLGLIEAGVRIVQLSPSELVYDEKADEMALMLAIVELSRGHRESKRKSDMVGAAWREKKKRAREGGEVLTHMIPAWVEERGGKFRLLPEPAAAVRRVYDLALAGYGATAIMRRLNAEAVRPIGTSGKWVRSYIALMLRDRRAAGEFQPRLRSGDPDGPPIANYYPPVVTDDEWHAVQAAKEQRWNKRGRTGKNVNPFAGLVKNALDGDSYILNTRPSRHSPPALVNLLAMQGEATHRQFPFAVFEAAVLSLLREVNPLEIINGDHGPDEVLVLSGELARLESKIAELEAELLNGDVAALAKVLRQLEAQKVDVAGRLAVAQQKAASPLAASWGECQSLLAALDAAPDPADARLRLRGVLRRLVEEIRLLVVPRKTNRLAAVQVWFAGKGRCRTYLVLYRRPQSNGVVRKEGGWWARSFADVAAPDGLDLRDPGHARRLEAALARLDLTGLDT